MIFNGRSLKEFETMLVPTSEDINHYGNALLFNELNYDVNDM